MFFVDRPQDVATLIDYYSLAAKRATLTRTVSRVGHEEVIEDVPWEERRAELKKSRGSRIGSRDSGSGIGGAIRGSGIRRLSNAGDQPDAAKAAIPLTPEKAVEVAAAVVAAVESSGSGIAGRKLSRGADTSPGRPASSQPQQSSPVRPRAPSTERPPPAHVDLGSGVTRARASSSEKPPLSSSQAQVDATAGLTASANSRISNAGAGPVIRRTLEPSSASKPKLSSSRDQVSPARTGDTTAATQPRHVSISEPTPPPSTSPMPSAGQRQPSPQPPGAPVPTPSAPPRMKLSGLPGFSVLEQPEVGGDDASKKRARAQLRSAMTVMRLQPAAEQAALQNTQQLASREFQNSGRLFEDPAFQQEQAQLTKSTHRLHQIVWLRPSQVAGAGPSPQLCHGSAQASDVVQGALGDCWFLGSLCVVAQDPALFKQLLAANDAHAPSGCYRFRFFKLGQWHDVVIDDRIPCDAKTKRPVYSSCKRPDDLWVQLVEKAYAKWHGGYANIKGGFISQALMDLTGGVPYKFNLDSMSEEDLRSGRVWDIMSKAQSTRTIMGCSYSPPSGGKSETALPSGILTEHAYSVLDVRLVGEKKHRLIKLRNPWGNCHWEGRWAESSASWTDALKKEVGGVTAGMAARDGIFWLSYEEFISHFNRLYACRTFPNELRTTATGEWKGRTAGGCRNYPTWRNNPQYLLRVKQGGVANILLEQEILENDHSDVPSIGFLVLKHSSASPQRAVQLLPEHTLAQAEFCNNGAIGAEVKLEAGEQYLVLPQTFRPRCERTFVVSVLGVPCTLELLPLPGRDVQVTGAWKGKTAAGSRNHATWQQNPVIRLSCSEPFADCTLVLEQSAKSSGHHPIGMYVWKQPSFATLVGEKCTFMRGPEVCVVLKAADIATCNGEVILMPCTLDAGTEDTFTITAHSSAAVTLKMGL